MDSLVSIAAIEKLSKYQHVTTLINPFVCKAS